jgi:hypothetical protein
MINIPCNICGTIVQTEKQQVCDECKEEADLDHKEIEEAEML